ncbi:MAG: hypothetical protein WCP39_07920 [Chlamydiota bacterium]
MSFVSFIPSLNPSFEFQSIFLTAKIDSLLGTVSNSFDSLNIQGKTLAANEILQISHDPSFPKENISSCIASLMKVIGEIQHPLHVPLKKPLAQAVLHLCQRRDLPESALENAIKGLENILNDSTLTECKGPVALTIISLCSKYRIPANAFDSLVDSLASIIEEPHLLAFREPSMDIILRLPEFGAISPNVQLSYFSSLGSIIGDSALPISKREQACKIVMQILDKEPISFLAMLSSKF